VSVLARDPEYDRFGPWVIEISDDDPVPPLFAGHVSEASDVILSIKVPRKVARRDAAPGMDLYDYVVQLHEQTLAIHERVHSTVRSHTVAYREIQQLRVSEHLLRGELLLDAGGAGYSLPYNTVSNDLMREVARLIRQRYLDPSATRLELPPAPSPAPLSFHFMNLLHEAQADGRSRALASQETVPLGALERGRLRRWLAKLAGQRLLESIHLCDGLELRIIDRGYTYAHRWQSLYGRRETFIPLANIRGLGWETRDDGSAELTVRTDGGEGSWAFSGDLQHVEEYVAWLERLA
jgi:hypothetical protein